MIGNIVKAFKSKRTIIAVITALLVSVNSQLPEPILDGETLNKLVAIIGALIVGDSLRSVAPVSAEK
tara:strand:+ start:2681 stop:2881 length:201 start_codon:yes stop_codon:yes gene_type:complete